MIAGAVLLTLCFLVLMLQPASACRLMPVDGVEFPTRTASSARPCPGRALLLPGNCAMKAPRRPRPRCSAASCSARAPISTPRRPCAGLLERAFAETVATGARREALVLGRHLAGRPHRGARSGQRHRAGRRSGQALAFGPGHVERTPARRRARHRGLSAHRDTHFRFLKDVALGDEITVTRRDGRTVRYRADRSSIVRFDGPSPIR